MKSKAFTLVELLVVIAIIGVLIALLLPAVQSAREAARRTQCTNQLKQLGIAMHNYHDTIRALPPGGFGSHTTKTNAEYGNGLGWHVLILPFIEQDALYEKFSFVAGSAVDGATYDPATTADGTRKFIWSSVLVPGYHCPSGDDLFAKIPSRNLTAVGRMPYTIHYAGVAGTYGYKEEGSTETYTVKTIGTARSNQEGALPYQKGITMGGFDDGTSNTIMIGEQTGGSCKKCLLGFDGVHDRYKGCYGIDGWVRGQVLAATKNIAFGLNTFVPYVGTGTSTYGSAPTSNTQLGDLYGLTPFNAHHPIGVNFVFGDGSVFMLAETIDVYMLKRLGNRCDGNSVDFQ